MVLAILLNRTEKNMERVVSSPVRIPRELDVSNIVVQFDRKEMCQYELFSVISLAA